MKALLGIPCLLYKVYVGIVFVSTLLLFYPFLLVVLSRKSWRKYSFPLNVFWSHLVRLLMLVFVWKISSPKIPKGPYLIIANHASYFDIFLMYSLLPNHRFLFLGKSEILSYPLVKTFFKRLNIPVFRNDRRKAAQSFMQARQAIREGWSLVVFPEGGIPDEGQPAMVPFKEGAFKLAKGAGIPIVPITFIDNYHLFSDPGNMLGPAHPGISRVIIHPVIDKKEVKQLSESELLEKTYAIISGPLIERGLMKKK
ncbi:MAG TPA: lysophospholipid acyltransferase family protein [Fluviicola sp.]|nr:lysophospholipid acyltransferase family protein [Fluviicola sp.]